MRSLAEGKWSGLEVLDLGQNKVNSWGIRHLSRTHLPSIVIVRLGNNPIGAEGVSHLSKVDWPVL